MCIYIYTCTDVQETFMYDGMTPLRLDFFIVFQACNCQKAEDWQPTLKTGAFFSKFETLKLWKLAQTLETFYKIVLWNVSKFLDIANTLDI